MASITPHLEDRLQHTTTHSQMGRRFINRFSTNMPVKGLSSQWTITKERKRGMKLSDALDTRITQTLQQIQSDENWETDEIRPGTEDVAEIKKWLRLFYRELVVPTRDSTLLPRFSLSGQRRFGFFWNTSAVNGMIQMTNGGNLFIATLRDKRTGKKESRELDLDPKKPWSDDWAWLRQRLRK